MNQIIGVIISIYNTESTMSVSIKSVLNQRFKHFELILINDGSQDDS